MTKEELNAHHEICYEALCEVDQILRNNNIPYYLLAGSTLGAIRHGGFIPWDDDIDIGVYRADYKKVVELIRNNISDKYTFEDCYTTANFPRFFGKVIYRKNMRGCIDFFPLVVTSNNILGRRIQWTTKKILYKVYKAKIGYVHMNEKHGIKHHVKRALAKAVAFFTPMKKLMKTVTANEMKYEMKYKGKNHKYYVVLYGAHSMENETIETKWLEREKYVKFNGREFPTIGDTHAYLTNMYGDYMTPPKESERALRHDEQFNR